MKRYEMHSHYSVVCLEDEVNEAMERNPKLVPLGPPSVGTYSAGEFGMDTHEIIIQALWIPPGPVGEETGWVRSEDGKKKEGGEK